MTDHDSPRMPLDDPAYSLDSEILLRRVLIAELAGPLLPSLSSLSRSELEHLVRRLSIVATGGILRRHPNVMAAIACEADALQQALDARAATLRTRKVDAQARATQVIGS